MKLKHLAAPAPLVRERRAREAALRPGARDLFPVLRQRLHASRPEVGLRVRFVPNRTGRLIPVQEKVYGKPTFRNVIEDGEHR